MMGHIEENLATREQFQWESVETLKEKRCRFHQFRTQSLSFSLSLLLLYIIIHLPCGNAYESFIVGPVFNGNKP
jgi:hypothetical protein